MMSQTKHLYTDSSTSASRQRKTLLPYRPKRRSIKYWNLVGCALLSFTALICSALPCYALSCYALPCYAMSCYALSCYALPCYALPCYALPCQALPCYALLCYTRTCYAMFCLAMPCLKGTIDLHSSVCPEDSARFCNFFREFKPIFIF